MKNAVVLTLLVVAASLVVPALAADTPAALPDGFKGFRGLLKGAIVSKAEGQFVLKVDSVVKTFPANKATKPEAAVGQQLTIKVKAEKLVKTLADLKVDDVVVVGVFNNEGDNLLAVEQLQKAETPKVQTPKTDTPK